MNRPSRQRRNGLTLIEALLAAVVLAMAILAILMPFTAGAQNELADTRRIMAVSLAQGMMEEILSKPFQDPQGASSPGPEPDETTRALFDNIDDYDGYQETSGNLTSFDGEIVSEPAAAGLSREVSAAYAYVSGQSTSQDPTFIRVVVEVKYHGSPVLTLTRLVYSLH